jgi:hypothetical protein
MTRPLTGLSGLAGYQVQINEDAQATPEQRMGGEADPSHSKYLAEDYIRRGAQLGEPRGPYGPENQILSDEGWFWEAGGEPSEDPQHDYTPNNHAGPWLKGVQSGPVGDIGPDATSNKLRQSAALHAMGLNGSARVDETHVYVQNDEWQEINELNPGHSDLASLPKQSMSSGYGWGTRDRIQSMGAQNDFGFDSSHQHRRFATGSIPGNTMWMKPGGRPLFKSLPGPARPPIGVDSPFSGQDLGASFSYDGAILQNVPTEYVAPPQPNLAAAPSTTDNDSFPEWY